MKWIKFDRTSFLTNLLAGSLIYLTESAFASDIASLFLQPTSDKKNNSRAAVRHIEAGGVGYDKGYTTLEGFFALDPEVAALI
ncbi:MAG: hypothetical protein Q8L68_03895 [Methylococcales bacterium]|nr:hypothetical protein [Methylococcales bacterium]